VPRDVLDAEIQRILDLGVALQLNAKVTNILDAMREGSFDAAFLAVGAHIVRRRPDQCAMKPFLERT